MFRSLRFRIPALFLLGIVLAGVVATLIAVTFFQSYTRTHAASELRGESAGLVRLYEGQAGTGHVSLENLELPLGGDQVFWVPIVPGATLNAGTLPSLPGTAVPVADVLNGTSPTFNLTVQGRGYFGVGQVV